MIYCLASSVVKFSSPTFLTISCSAFCLASFLLYSLLFMFHRHSCYLYSSTYLHVNSSFQLAGILNTQIVPLKPKQIIRTNPLLAHYWQVRVHTRQVKGSYLLVLVGEGKVPQKYNCLISTCLAWQLVEKVALPQNSGKLTATRGN